MLWPTPRIRVSVPAGAGLSAQQDYAKWIGPPPLPDVLRDSWAWTDEKLCLGSVLGSEKEVVSRQCVVNTGLQNVTINGNE